MHGTGFPSHFERCRTNISRPERTRITIVPLSTDSTSWRDPDLAWLSQKEFTMKKVQPHARSLVITVVLAAESLLPRLATAQADVPRPLLPGSFHWLSPAGKSCLKLYVGVGKRQRTWTFHSARQTFRGRKDSAAHTCQRTGVTVLAGTVHLGFGESFDESKLIALPAGAVCVIPSNVPHYVWARDGEAIYQEAGVGVTGTSFVHPPR
jgi:hypothetical protein